jgi:hypothetical protein
MRSLVRGELGSIVPILIGLTLCVSSRVPAFAQDFRVRRSINATLKANHYGQVENHTNLNARCEGLEPPTINLDEPPQHGVVCLRIRDNIIRSVVTAALRGCIGHKIRGIRVIYLPRYDYTGSDTLSYTVRYLNGQMKVDASLTIVPDEPESRDTVPPDINAPENDVLQPKGPVPECTALVS